MSYTTDRTVNVKYSSVTGYFVHFIKMFRNACKYRLRTQRWQREFSEHRSSKFPHLSHTSHLNGMRLVHAYNFSIHVVCDVRTRQLPHIIIQQLYVRVYSILICMWKSYCLFRELFFTHSICVQLHIVHIYINMCVCLQCYVWAGSQYILRYRWWTHVNVHLLLFKYNVLIHLLSNSFSLLIVFVSIPKSLVFFQQRLGFKHFNNVWLFLAKQNYRKLMWEMRHFPK